MPQSDNGLTFGDSESGNGLTFQKPPSVNGLDPSLASPDWDKVIGRYSNSTVPGTKGPEDLQSAVDVTKQAFESARAKKADVAPTEERGLLGEFGTAALRGAAQVPVSLKKLSAIVQGKDSENIRLTHALDPSRDDVTGKVANFAGGFVPILTSGGASKYVPAAIFGLEGFTRTYERTQGNIPASVAVSAIDAGLGLVPVHALFGKLPGIEQAVEKLGVAGVQKVLTKRSLEMLSSGTAGAIQNAADEYLARAGGAEPQETNMLEAGLGMGLAHGVLAGPKILSELKGGLQTKQVYQAFVKEKLLSSLEAEQLKADPKLAAQVVRERLGNKNVSLVTGPDGKLVVDSKPDTVPWSLKRAAGHNEVKIQFMRDEIAAGRTTIFEDTSRLPPLPEEIAESSTKLTKLHEQLTAEVPPTEFTALGRSVTERALYVRDLKLAFDRLATEPTRENYEIAQGLMREKSSLGKSTEIITADRSAASVDSKEILSDYDPTPPSTIRLPLLESEAKGYFKPPEEITNDPKLVVRVAAAQRKSMLDSSALTNTSKLTAAEKVEMFGVLDAEHQARIEGILEKDPTTSTTKAKIKSRVSRVKSDPKKIEALTALDRSFETVAKHSENPSERELNDLLKLELKDAPPEIQELLAQVKSGTPLSELTSKLAHAEYLKRVAKGESGDEAGDWAKAEQRLRRSLVDVTLAKTRDQIVMGLKGLSAEQGRPFIDELTSAKSPKEIQVTADKITKAQQVEQRKTEYELIKRLTSKLDQKLARDPVLDTFVKRVQPPKLAEAPETVSVRAMKIGEKVYEAKPGTDKTLEETHADVITRIEAEQPSLKKQLTDLRLGDQDASEFGYVTSKGRYVTRAEAEALKSGQASTIESSPKAGSGKGSKPPKPIVETDPSTGKRSTNWKLAQVELDKLSNDQVTSLANELKELTRAAAIERGIYNRWLGFSTSRDNQALSAAIIKSAKPRGALAQRYEKWTHGLSNWINPITTESWLAQMSGFDENNPIRKILHGDIVDGQTRSYQNQANARRSLAEHSKATLGFDTNTTRGMEKLWAYLLKPIHGDFTRGEAINAYLISRDPGRQDINEIGIIKNGVRAQVSELVPKLTPKDLEFGERLRRYFDQNPVVEKTISNFTLLNGHEPPRNPDHWVSGRAPSEVAPKPGEKPSALDLYATYKVGIERMINPLRERMDGVHTPYEARDVVGEYLRASDQISDFAEMGLPLFRATQTLYSPEVVEAINKHWGRGGYEKVQLYLADIMGTVGTQRTLTDDLGNALINSYATSKIALNVGSAAKQTLDVLTFLAEGTLSKKAIAQAMAEGAWLNKGVTQRMMDNAGVAYLRYHGHFLDQISMASQTNQAPSKLQSWQYRGLILQRAIDKKTLSIAWRSAEIEAAAKGLKGNAALEDATKTFNLVVGRAQPTSNPLYSGELETQAKRNMLLRGSLLFMRAPNRIYNVVRRRVVEAVQNPTQENVSRAGQAVLFGLIGNTLGIVAINSLRRAVFNKPQDEKNLAGDTVDSLTGMFYLGAPANAIAAFLADQNTPSNRLERSPFLGMSKDLYDMTTHTYNAVNNDGDLVRSGPHRGESKTSKEGLQALESAFSLSGGVSGLPLWGLWNQGKGLYSWTEPQYRLMVEFEKEIRQLKADGREESLRYRELDEARDDINKYHQHRAKGLATEGSTQSAIERRLRQVVR